MIFIALSLVWFFATVLFLSLIQLFVLIVIAVGV